MMSNEKLQCERSLKDQAPWYVYIRIYPEFVLHVKTGDPIPTPPPGRRMVKTANH